MSAREYKHSLNPETDVVHNKVGLGTAFVTPVGIDTVRIRCPYDLEERGLGEITQGREVAPAGEDAYLEGYLDNFHIRVRPGSFVIQGSIATYLDGHNLLPASPEECEAAVEELGDILRVPSHALNAAGVGRLDGAMTAAMRHPVSEYLRTLGDRSRSLRRNHRDETVAYDVQYRTQHYYDKGLEMQKKKTLGRLPDELQVAHLLRYEVQYKRRVARQFGRTITVQDLCDPDFHRELKAKMLRLHEQVPKHRVLNLGEPLGTSRLRDRLTATGIEAAGGLDEVLSAIADGQTGGHLTRKQASRLRSTVRALATDNAFTLESAAAAELDEAIRHATST